MLAGVNAVCIFLISKRKARAKEGLDVTEKVYNTFNEVYSEEVAEQIDVLLGHMIHRLKSGVDIIHSFDRLETDLEWLKNAQSSH